MNIEDTTRAVRIVTADVKDNNFVQFAYEQEVFESNSTAIVQAVNEQLTSDNYTPTYSQQVEVPKGNGAVRPGSIITIKDQIAYTLLLESIYPDLHSEIAGTQAVTDFGYQLYPASDSQKWFRDWFVSWDSWKDDSLSKISQGYQFVVMTDITGFYENIDHKTLFNDLNRIHTPQLVVKTLRAMLKKWNPIDTKGLPQAIAASHLLAKLYLHDIDATLSNKDYVHSRYVDDIRIFCNSKAEAKRAIMDLSIALRKRGLNLQSSKTHVLEAEKAKSEIVGRATIIEILASRLKEEIDIEDIRNDPYASSIQINSRALNPAQMNVIKQAFNDYFLISEENEFDKSLFHYLIKRLGSIGDNFAVSYCMDSLEKRPQETKFILPYLTTIEDKDAILEELISILQSPNSVYDYQNYQIAKWLFDNELLTDSFLNYIRGIAFDNNKPVYFRTLAKQILGSNGLNSDVVAIHESYATASSRIEKDAIICSLYKLETSRRNSIYSELCRDEPESEYACSYARQL